MTGHPERRFLQACFKNKLQQIRKRGRAVAGDKWCKWCQAPIAPRHQLPPALHLPTQRSERGLLYFHHGLLVSRPRNSSYISAALDDAGGVGPPLNIPDILSSARLASAATSSALIPFLRNLFSASTEESPFPRDSNHRDSSH